MRRLAKLMVLLAATGCSLQYTDSKVHEEASVASTSSGSTAGSGTSASGSSGTQGGSSGTETEASSGSGSGTSQSSTTSSLGTSSGSTAGSTGSGSSTGEATSSSSTSESSSSSSSASSSSTGTDSSSSSSSGASTSGSTSGSSSGSSGTGSSSGSTGCASTALFAPPVQYFVGPNPGAIVAGQFEGAGGPVDLAVGYEGNYNAGDAGIMILFNDTDGGFHDGGNYNHMAHTPGPLALVASDFNVVGQLDIAFAGLTASQPGVGMLKNTGGGSFAVDLAYGSSSAAALLTHGPFEGTNGLDDLAWSGGSAPIDVLRNSGNSNFTLLNSFDGGKVGALASGDFNHDGIADLVTADTSGNTVSLLLGNGDGTFTPGGRAGVGSEPNYLLVGDFNGDQNLDVAVTNYGSSPGTISVILGSDDGGFQLPPTAYSVDFGPEWLTSADFNGDQVLDLAVANYSGGSVSVLLGNGDGSFRDGGLLSMGSGANGRASSVAAADLNGDGQPDLAATSLVIPGKVYVFINTGCPGP